MEQLIAERFFKVIESETQKLEKKEGHEVNPVGLLKDLELEKYGFDASYMYSLFSLQTAWGSLSSFLGDTHESKKTGVDRSELRKYKKRCKALPAEITYNLRGYIGVISEDFIMNDVQKAGGELQDLLQGWFDVGMVDGKEKDELRITISNCEVTYVGNICCAVDEKLWKEKVGKDTLKLVGERTDKKLNKLREVLLVSKHVVDSAFNNVQVEYDKGVFNKLKESPVMGKLVTNRFYQIIQNKADELREREGNEVNPIEVLMDFIGFEYTYSLANLDFVLDRLKSFLEDLSKREVNGKSKELFLADKKRASALPSQVAFYLRGYIGAVSENDMVLERSKLQELQSLLYKWSFVYMSEGKEQNELYKFLFGYATYVVLTVYNNDPGVVTAFAGNVNEVIASLIVQLTEEKMKTFKEILSTVDTLVRDEFDSVWAGYVV